jgi:cytochrome c biogenesis protein CcdA
MTLALSFLAGILSTLSPCVLPLLLGVLSREAILRWRSRAIGLGGGMRFGLGAVLAVVGAAVLAGLDKRLEAVLVSLSPDWLTRLTTAY